MYSSAGILAVWQAVNSYFIYIHEVELSLVAKTLTSINSSINSLNEGVAGLAGVVKTLVMALRHTI